MAVEIDCTWCWHSGIVLYRWIAASRPPAWHPELRTYGLRRRQGRLALILSACSAHRRLDRAVRESALHQESHLLRALCGICRGPAKLSAPDFGRARGFTLNQTSLDVFHGFSIQTGCGCCRSAPRGDVPAIRKSVFGIIVLLLPARRARRRHLHPLAHSAPVCAPAPGGCVRVPTDTEEPAPLGSFALLPWCPKKRGRPAHHVNEYSVLPDSIGCGRRHRSGVARLCHHVSNAAT
jgi:hypothetical protein